MILEDKDLEVIGSPAVVQYDDTTVILQHIESGLWLSYKVVQQFHDTKLEEQTLFLLRIFKWHLLLHFGRRTKWRKRELVLLRRSKSSFTKRDEWMTGSLSPGKLVLLQKHALKQNAIWHSFWAVSFTLQQFGKPNFFELKLNTDPFKPEPHETNPFRNDCRSVPSI